MRSFYCNSIYEPMRNILKNNLINIMNKNIKYLIEDIVNFNPVDYSDEEPDLIDDQIISNLVYKYFPKTKEELIKII